MIDKDTLAAISAMMDSKLETALNPIHERLDKVDARLDKVDARLDKIEKRLDKVEEDTQVTRSAVNTLLAWAEKAQVQVQIPLFQNTGTQG